MDKGTAQERVMQPRRACHKASKSIGPECHTGGVTVSVPTQVRGECMQHWSRMRRQVK